MGGSLSRGVSVQGGFLSRGCLCPSVSFQGRVWWKSERYASYWNAFFFVSFIRTQLLPDFRGVAVNEAQKEWVATTLKRFLNCAFTKLSPEILEDWKVVFKSAASEGKSLMNCLKGKYETMAFFIKPRFSYHV